MRRGVVVAGLATAILLAGCGSGSGGNGLVIDPGQVVPTVSPTTSIPTASPTPSPSPTFVGLEFSASPLRLRPEVPATVRVVARFSDGSEQERTQEVSWRPRNDNPAGIAVVNGQFLATDLGWVEMEASVAGATANLMVFSSASAYSSGRNGGGVRLGHGSSVDEILENVPIALPNGVRAVWVEAGFQSSLALGDDGLLYAWGPNGGGALGDGTQENRNAPVVVQLPAGVRAVQAKPGWNHMIVLGNDGEVYTCGSNFEGQLGNGSIGGNRLVPERVDFGAPVKFVSVAAGARNSLAVGTDGRVYSWGQNDQGQVGDGTMVNRGTPFSFEVEPGVRAVRVHASPSSSMALTDQGTLYGWGRNASGLLGIGNSNSPQVQAQKVLIPDGERVTEFCTLSNHSLAVSESGQLYGSGSNDKGQIAQSGLGPRNIPTLISLPAGEIAVQLGGNSDGSIVLTNTNTLYEWGRPEQPQNTLVNLPAKTNPTVVTGPPGTKVYAVTQGQMVRHILAEPTTP